MNLEMRPRAKRWINKVVGWNAAGVIEESMTEEDIEEAQKIADEMGDWEVEGYTPEDFDIEIRANQREMIRKGKVMKQKAGLQKKYLEKLNNASTIAEEMTWEELAADVEDEMRMVMKEILAHSARASKLRKWKSAITSKKIEEGGNEHVNLGEIGEAVKDEIMAPEKDEVSPEMAQTEVAVEQQLENVGGDRSRERIREKASELEEKGEDADIDIGLSEQEVEEMRNNESSHLTETN